MATRRTNTLKLYEMRLDLCCQPQNRRRCVCLCRRLFSKCFVVVVVVVVGWFSSLPKSVLGDTDR